MTAVIGLSTAFARATFSPIAGMLIDATFLIDGRQHHPFARAPWIGEPGLDDQPGHLRMLGAEFVAVPFGSAGAPQNVVPEWSELIPAEAPKRPHGRSADDQWRVDSVSENHVVLSLDYPEPEGISRLERRVTLRSDAPVIDCVLTLEARRPVTTAVGLHPILRLPETPGALTLETSFAAGHTYPGDVWPGVGPSAPGRVFSALDAVPARAGGVVDLSCLPLVSRTEDVVLLADMRGPLLATFHDEGTRLVLDWDRAIIPNLMLWLSDGALTEEPWRGRYRGLGVEPIAAAFDFDDSVSTSENPLSRAGHVTCVSVTPGAPTRIEYSVSVSSVDEYV